MSATADDRKLVGGEQEPTETPGRGARPLRILVVVDSSERTERVVKFLLDLRVCAIKLVLLNVQPKPQDWRLRGYGWFKREAIHDRLINDLGRRVVASAARQLDSAGIAHKDRIELGEPGETVLRCAREEDSELIVLAEPRHGAVRTWLMRALPLSVGSTAGFVIHFARVPVVVVP